MFRTVPLSIIRSFSLYTQHWYTSYKFADSLRAASCQQNRYPFYRRLGGPQSRSGRAENLVPTGIRSRTFQPVVSRYTDWATVPTFSFVQPIFNDKEECLFTAGNAIHFMCQWSDKPIQPCCALYAAGIRKTHKVYLHNTNICANVKDVQVLCILQIHDITSFPVAPTQAKISIILPF